MCLLFYGKNETDFFGQPNALISGNEIKKIMGFEHEFLFLSVHLIETILTPEAGITALHLAVLSFAV